MAVAWGRVALLVHVHHPGSSVFVERETSLPEDMGTRCWARNEMRTCYSRMCPFPPPIPRVTWWPKNVAIHSSWPSQLKTLLKLWFQLISTFFKNSAHEICCYQIPGQATPEMLSGKFTGLHLHHCQCQGHQKDMSLVCAHVTEKELSKQTVSWLSQLQNSSWRSLSKHGGLFSLHSRDHGRWGAQIVGTDTLHSLVDSSGHKSATGMVSQDDLGKEWTKQRPSLERETCRCLQTRVYALNILTCVIV